MVADLPLPRYLTPGANQGGPAIQTRGSMACYVLERREFPAMIAASDAGDYRAAQVRVGVGLWAEKAFGVRYPKCATCETHFQNSIEPDAFFLAIPQRGDGDSLVGAVCKKCAKRIGSEGMLAAAIEHFKKVWPAATVTGKSVHG